MLQLSTTEDGNETQVFLHVDGANFQVIGNGFSDTFDLEEDSPATNPVLETVLRHLISVDDGVRFLGVLEVRNITGNKVTLEVPRMKSLDPEDGSNGLIVLHDSSATAPNFIKGKIRTSGKVTNKMGPLKDKIKSCED
jgi:hypothetical protein